MLAVIMLSCFLCQCKSNKVDDGEEVDDREAVEDIEISDDLIITEGSCFPDVVDKYVYPITPRSEGRETMTLEEQWKACQLPDDVLKSISSLGLIRSLYDMPRSISLLYIGSSNPSGFSQARALPVRFNSVQELLTREDAASSLMTFYAATKLDCIESWSTYSSKVDCQLATLEYLFSFSEILDQLSREDKKKVVKKFLANYEIFFQVRGSWPPCVRLMAAMIWVMYDDMLPYFDEKILTLAKWSHAGINIEVVDSIDDIIAFAKKFILK